MHCWRFGCPDTRGFLVLFAACRTDESDPTRKHVCSANGGVSSKQNNATAVRRIKVLNSDQYVTLATCDHEPRFRTPALFEGIKGTYCGRQGTASNEHACDFNPGETLHKHLLANNEAASGRNNIVNQKYMAW